MQALRLEVNFLTVQWSPHIEDPLFSNQSATLYITYYMIQIIIYRPFGPPSLQSPMNIVPHINMPIPCIAICVNAGKCVSRILKAQMSRGYWHTPTLILGSHVCAAILLMNFWDLKWQERKQLRCDAFEDVKSPLSLAMAELLEDVSVFIEALESVKPRWRNAEMYLSALLPLFAKSTKCWLNRNDLSSSFPHGLGGFEPSIPMNDPISRRDPPRLNDRACHDAAPPDYTILGDHRNPPPEYRIAPPPVNTYTYDTQVEPSERSPHFFEYPHITRYPVPSTLPFSSSSTLGQRDQSMPTQATTFRSQRSYDRLSMHTELGDRRSSTSSIHSRPASLFDERVMDETPKIQHGPSICRQYAIASRAPYGGPVSSAPTRQNTASNVSPNQTRYACRYALLCVTYIIS